MKSLQDFYVEEKVKEDFFQASDLTAELIEEFDNLGLDIGPAIGGALTQMIAHLIATAPDANTAMGMLSSCMSNATLNAETTELEIVDKKEFH